VLSYTSCCCCCWQASILLLVFACGWAAIMLWDREFSFVFHSLHSGLGTQFLNRLFILCSVFRFVYFKQTLYSLICVPFLSKLFILCSVFSFKADSLFWTVVPFSSRFFYSRLCLPVYKQKLYFVRDIFLHFTLCFTFYCELRFLI
jgi:hypothetical protein